MPVGSTLLPPTLTPPSGIAALVRPMSAHVRHRVRHETLQITDSSYMSYFFPRSNAFDKKFEENDRVTYCDIRMYVRVSSILGGHVGRA